LPESCQVGAKRNRFRHIDAGSHAAGGDQRNLW
jgi:hypothetical protein